MGEIRCMKKKIYSDDPLVHYKDSTVAPERTKVEIDMMLAQWGVKDSFWHWDPEHNSVYVQFKIEEIVPVKDQEGSEIPIEAVVKVECPTIWDKASPRAHTSERRTEKINWRISMRALHWFLKSHLEMAYAMQSSKTRAFLSYVRSTDGDRDLGDYALPRLQKLRDQAALPEKVDYEAEAEKEDMAGRER